MKPADPKTLNPILNGFKVNSELPDPEAKGVIGVDPAGRPILQSLIGSKFFDLPYELNLGQQAGRGLPSPILPSPNTAPDNPFSVNELERILRPYDRDAAQLPARLATLTSSTGLPQNSVLIEQRNNRQEVTTESWDMPVYTAGLPPYLLKQVQKDLKAVAPAPKLTKQVSWLPPRHITDLLKAYYYYQLRNSAPPINPDPAADQAELMVNSMTSTQLASLFAPEMLAGLKININKPFPGPGNGANNDPNAFGKVALWQSLGIGGAYGGFWFGQIPDYPDGTNDANNAPFAARQLYARYLYVLALLLCDRDTANNRLTQAQWIHPPEDTTLSPDQKEELTKRRIAQWAINAACFKINDSIMVPFEFDVDPLGYDSTTYKLNIWRVDGILTTKEHLDPADPMSPIISRVAWGCKPPDMILTETLALHDRRIADTSWDNGLQKKTTDPVNPDVNFDQTRVPQGSAFFEMYCCRDLHGSTPSADLYTYDSTAKKWYLDLGRLAPADAVNNIPQYPVWRLAISESRIRNANNNVRDRLNNKPDSLSLEPEQYTGQLVSNFSLIDPSEPKVAIERIVWFTNNPPTTHRDADRIYFNQKGTSVLLEPGYNAVVGPRELTVMGLTSDVTSDPQYNKLPIGKPSSQKITLAAPNASQVTNLSNNPDTNIDVNKIKLPLGIVVSNHPAGWSGTTSVGISISEPLLSSYYPEPTVAGPDGVKEWYGDPQMNDPIKGYFHDTPYDTLPGKPLADDGIQWASTRNYKTVFLQRLANPLAPYHPEANPYLTVDWMPIDLTVFNGDDNLDPYNIMPDPYDTTLPAYVSRNQHYATRQRGNASANFNIWAPNSDDPQQFSLNLASNAYFNYDLGHSLGYLNQAFWNTQGTTGTRTNVRWIMSGNEPDELASLGLKWPVESYGDPYPSYTSQPSDARPFPWLPWFGRPYVSQMELMLVPASHPARLLWEFQPCQTGTTNQYSPTQVSEVPFPQLLNFQQSGNANGMNQFARILECVGVPSQFMGTDIQINPTAASAPISALGSHNFFPPFNRISTYREPGRINLNTIYSRDVFNGLMNGNNTPSWQDFIANRRGYGTSGNPFEMDSGNPSQFGNPFRSSGSVYWNPFYQYMPVTEINATYMRPLDPTFGTSNNPLFQYASDQQVDNSDRNPYFHYSDMMRLGNLVTTRSNVYSVWITVGYFEVKPHKDTVTGRDNC